MRSLLSETHFGRRLSFRLLLAGFSLLAFTPSLLADTPALLRGTPTAGCYCHCAESKQHGGCLKMFESKKYASRWWAKSCAKPHMSTPNRDSHGGPRFPPPRRCAHAELSHSVLHPWLRAFLRSGFPPLLSATPTLPGPPVPTL